MRVGEDQRRGERTENDVSKLDAPWRDCITESEVVLAQELGKVMKENKEKTESPAIQVFRSELKIGTLEEGSQKLE